MITAGLRKERIKKIKKKDTMEEEGTLWNVGTPLYFPSIAFHVDDGSISNTCPLYSEPQQRKKGCQWPSLARAQGSNFFSFLVTRPD